MKEDDKPHWIDDLTAEEIHAQIDAFFEELFGGQLIELDGVMIDQSNFLEHVFPNRELNDEEYRLALWRAVLLHWFEWRRRHDRNIQ